MAWFNLDVLNEKLHHSSAVCSLCL